MERTGSWLNAVFLTLFSDSKRRRLDSRDSLFDLINNLILCDVEQFGACYKRWYFGLAIEGLQCIISDWKTLQCNSRAAIRFYLKARLMSRLILFVKEILDDERRLSTLIKNPPVTSTSSFVVFAIPPLTLPFRLVADYRGLIWGLKSTDFGGVAAHW